MKTQFAKLVWMAGDVQEMARENGRTMTHKQAVAWLERNEKQIRDQLCARGSEIIGDLLTFD